MKKVKFIVFICLFILLPLAYFNGFIRISDLTSEQESIAKKYGGVYVFDEKLEKEIDKLEALNKDIRAKRSSLYQEIKQELDNNSSKYFQEFNNNKSNYIDMVMQDIFNDKFCKREYDEFIAASKDIMKIRHACININERARGKFINEIVDKTYHVYDRLSNGKRYYTNTRDYGSEFKKKAEVPEIYLNKIIDFIGNDIFYKWQPFISMSYFYLDDNKNIIPIKTSVNYYKGYKIFGLYGDEASGIRLYKETSINISGDNFFYFTNNKFEKISNKSKDK
ncbi:hypothetical protein [Campylobacter concisus]|uniref:hypothetical protein n=1 Tax=Campylobacter concisus TaxID=199 RepID=UPI000CD94343|nr:hypothetical protein [Campylobacter concisus]